MTHCWKEILNITIHMCWNEIRWDVMQTLKLFLDHFRQQYCKKNIQMLVIIYKIFKESRSLICNYKRYTMKWKL